MLPAWDKKKSVPDGNRTHPTSFNIVQQSCIEQCWIMYGANPGPNARPPALQTDALPTDLTKRIFFLCKGRFALGLLFHAQVY